MNQTPAILTLADAGVSPAAIALEVPCSLGHVYGVLREHRPARARAKRTRTSEVPAKVAGLHGQGIAPSRIAFLLGVSKAYVYRILQEGTK